MCLTAWPCRCRGMLPHCGSTTSPAAWHEAPAAPATTAALHSRRSGHGALLSQPAASHAHYGSGRNTTSSSQWQQSASARREATIQEFNMVLGGHSNQLPSRSRTCWFCTLHMHTHADASALRAVHTRHSSMQSVRCRPCDCQRASGRCHSLEHKTVALLLRHRGVCNVKDGVSQAACRAHDWDRPVAQRDELRQAAWLKEGRDEDDVCGCVDPAGTSRGDRAGRCTRCTSDVWETCCERPAAFARHPGAMAAAKETCGCEVCSNRHVDSSQRF